MSELNIEGIVLDSGHGGSDPGASGNGIVEKDYTLKISQYMYDRFKELGIPVKMTRTTDETVSPSERTKRVLDAYGNRDDVIVISNHLNAGGGDGAEVIYALRNSPTLSNLVLTELGKQGQNIRKAYQRKLTSNPSKDYYFMHRNTGDTESIIVEYGFLDSTKDDVSQIKNNWQKYAEAVVQAVLQYIGYTGGSIDKDNIYTVKKGDTLYGISKRFGIPVSEIKQINNLTSDILSIGQELYLSNTPIEGYTYTVQTGDTLYSIASKYDMTVDQLKELNGLSSNLLSVGQVLLVKSDNNTPMGEYVVKKGDTLYGIAQQLGTTVDNLKKINNLTSNVLSIGQVLLTNSSGITGEVVENTYTVQAGDTLYSVAKKYGISVDTLKQMNGLTNNLLSIGQNLIVP